MFFSLDNTSSDSDFPDPRLAESEPNGLLAIGGDLSVTRLSNAYRSGIFPWFSAGEPILWWSPDPRLLLIPEKIHISRSLRKTLRRGDYRTTFDEAFCDVIGNCAATPRSDQPGTWIIGEMIDAYTELHHHGYAHSVEVWHGTNLVGGLYGVAIGSAFYGESMFSLMSNASKIALVALTRKLQHDGFHFIDCQMETPHLLTLGAETVPREEFLKMNAVASQRQNSIRWHDHE
ncbi:MAG: leucyl/phenylalanyl-tRNA--protein transferase [Pseudomonadota bacterium]|nr:leucyl/phenylalanyl-tRNA--protein transferase [Pseudomonadota bacterium]